MNNKFYNLVNEFMRRVIGISKRPAHGFPQRFLSHYNFVVAGGGSGGCAVASNLAKHGSVAVVDPADVGIFNI